MKFLIPRLEAFGRQGGSWFLNNKEVRARNICDEIVKGLKAYLKTDSEQTKQDVQSFNRALKLFKENFTNLWT